MNKKQERHNSDTYKAISSYLAAASSTIIQTTFTHPLDTVAKRSQNNQWSFVKKSLASPFPANISWVWAGFPAAVAYRTTACTITLGSQPLIQQYIEKEYGFPISQFTGDKYRIAATQALSGAMFGMIEVGFLPLDRWKILRQVGNAMPFYKLLKQEKSHLYFGASITCLRNLTCYPILFGVSNLSEQYFSDTSQTQTITLFQRTLSSGIGAVASIVASNPADTIKTRMQAQSHAAISLPDSAIKTAIKIYEENGVTGFSRGVWPRLFSTVPRITFLKTLHAELTPLINEALHQGTDKMKR